MAKTDHFAFFQARIKKKTPSSMGKEMAMEMYYVRLKIFNKHRKKLKVPANFNDYD